MLTATPLTNNNFFSSVAAQEYGYEDNYDDNMYSKYPTEEKKYECQKGPLEGFFVSSVEFCKRVASIADDNGDDNRTGTQGPIGPHRSTRASRTSRRSSRSTRPARTSRRTRSTR